MIFVPPLYQLKKMSSAELDRIAVRLFSTYIRTKDADFTGLVGCFTCSQVAHWSEMHCGHFVRRSNMCTRFMEINNHPQCPTCNIEKDGNVKKYAKMLDKVYGGGTAEEIERLGRQTCKWVRSDYHDLITKLEGELNG